MDRIRLARLARFFREPLKMPEDHFSPQRRKERKGFSLN